MTEADSEQTMEFRAVTIPLYTEKWQRDLLLRRMNLCCSIYNTLLNDLITRKQKMTGRPEYMQYKSVIAQTYALAPAERAAYKSTGEYREALELQSTLFQEYQLTRYSVINQAIELARPYHEILPSRVAHFTVGLSAWNSFHEVLLGAKNGVKYKKEGDIHTLSSDGRSGIRLLADSSKGHRGGIDITQTPWYTGDARSPLFVVYGKTRGKHIIKLPLKIKRDDVYLIEMLSHPLTKICILRRRQHGHDKYYVQLLVRQEA